MELPCHSSGCACSGRGAWSAIPTTMCGQIHMFLGSILRTALIDLRRRRLITHSCRTEGNDWWWEHRAEHCKVSEQCRSEG